MPSFTAAPARLTLNGGAALFSPVRFAGLHASLFLSGWEVSAGPGTNLIGVSPEINLNVLNRQTTYFDQRGRPTQQMQVFFQQFRDGIVAALEGQQGQITDLRTVVARLEALQEMASAARTEAAQAVRETALAQSYVEPSNVLTASADGTITIAAHERVYGNGTRVSVDGGALTGWAPGQVVQVYYDDAGREGGAVVYAGTAAGVAQGGNRHVVGSAVVPEAGEPESDGFTPLPPGVVDPRLVKAYYLQQVAGV